MTEAEEAIHAVMAQDRPVELTPQRAYIRRLQHELAQRFNLTRRAGAASRSAACASCPAAAPDGHFAAE